jgi:hypothetical protein
MSLNDAEHWWLCAEEMRTAAEGMRSEECRATALRIAEDYDRLARHAERRAGHDGHRGGGETFLSRKLPGIRLSHSRNP